MHIRSPSFICLGEYYHSIKNFLFIVKYEMLSNIQKEGCGEML
jgi:hypothetical protein